MQSSLVAKLPTHRIDDGLPLLALSQRYGFHILGSIFFQNRNFRTDSSHNVQATDYVEILKAELQKEHELNREASLSIELPAEKKRYRKRESDDSWIPRVVRFGPKGRLPTLDDYDTWAWRSN